MVRYRQRTSWALEPILTFITVGPESDIRISSELSECGCKQSPFNQNWILRRRIELEDSGLPKLIVVASHDYRTICLPAR